MLFSVALEKPLVSDSFAEGTLTDVPFAVIGAKLSFLV